MTSVITGDIINSRNVSNKDWLAILNSFFDEVGELPKNWEIFRGDSFQIEINNIMNTFLIAIQLKSYLKTIKGIDVRMAIGIGSKNFNADTVTQSNGEAFIYSGEAFDGLSKKQTLAVKSPWKDFNEELDVALGLALLTMDNWTPNSAYYVKLALQFPLLTQKELAKKLKISQSSASERRKRSGIDEILKLEKRYRKLIAKKIEL